MAEQAQAALGVTSMTKATPVKAVLVATAAVQASGLAAQAAKIPPATTTVVVRPDSQAPQARPPPIPNQAAAAVAAAVVVRSATTEVPERMEVASTVVQHRQLAVAVEPGETRATQAEMGRQERLAAQERRVQLERQGPIPGTSGYPVRREEQVAQAAADEVVAAAVAEEGNTAPSATTVAAMAAAVAAVAPKAATAARAAWAEVHLTVFTSLPTVPTAYSTTQGS